MGTPTEIYINPSLQDRATVTITAVTTTASVSHTSHGYSNGNTVKIYGANETDYNGHFVISNVSANAYDYTMGGSPSSPATGTIKASKNTGAGTSGSPYSDAQWMLEQATRDATNGNRFNQKAGVDEILTAVLSYATFGTSGFDAPAIWQGYTSTVGDGGLFGIDANGGAAFPNAQQAIIDGRVHNGGSADLITLAADSMVRNLEVDDSTGSAIVYTSGNRGGVILGCNIHNIGTYGVNGGVSVIGCYFANGTNDFTSAIRNASTENGPNGLALRNIISIDGSSNGIEIRGYGIPVDHNSVLSSSGTGVGIFLSSSPIGSAIISNLVEGFSGGGGKGFDLNSTTRYQFSARNNAAYNNTTDYDIQGEFMDDEDDNESLGASPFDKSGADTFANRFTYFAPVDTGNVRGGAYPVGSRLDKGAVQHADPAGGGGTVNLLHGKL